MIGLIYSNKSKENSIMTKVFRSNDECLSLITACRSSGLSDRDWCRNNGIAPSSFYTASEISNNAAECRAKTYVTSRKNFLFHDTVEGAQASAMMLSIIETAKLNNLKVYQYLYMLFLYMPDYKEEPAGVEQLLPWSDFIKQHCSGLTDTETITSTNKPALEIKK